MALPGDSPPFVHYSVPNRSLGPVARRWALVSLAATALVVAAGAAALGAWLVVPFAGLEIAVLVLAFRIVRSHDSDFERLEVGRFEVRLEAREAARTTCFVAHRPWARMVCRVCGAQCSLRLAYAGRTEPVGRLLSDEGRLRLAEELRSRISVTPN